MTEKLVWVLASVLPAVAAGWAIRFGYTVVFGDSDKQLRSFLLKKQSQRKRRWYIRAFVTAVQRRAAISDGMVQAMTLLLVLVTASVSFATLGLILLLATADIEIDQRTAVIRIDNSLRELEGSSESKTAVELRTELKELRNELVGQEPRIRAMRLYTRVAFLGPAALMALSVAGFSFWLPLFLRRRIFAFEVERFTLRMQGLATPAELAELTLAEVFVQDEKSLREFIGVARRIAERHSVVQLVVRFDLWSPLQAS